MVCEHGYNFKKDCKKCLDLEEQNGNNSASVPGLCAAAEMAAKWMEWWLDQNECECEYGHNCGRPERLIELQQIKKAIALYRESK